MINCDICKKNINTLKDAHHTIPLSNNDGNYVMCDECYKKFIAYKGFKLWGDSKRFASHNYEALLFVCREVLVKVLAIQECSVHRKSGIKEFPAHLCQICIDYLFAENCPHGGLNHFRIIYFYRTRACKDCINTKPVCNADNGSQIARILNAIQNQHARFGDKGCFFRKTA